MHCKPKEKPNRTHIPRRYVGFWILFFGSVNRAYLRFRDHIGIGKKMGDKKRNGKWIWPMSFL